MKQAELDRELRRTCKLEAKRREWKSVGSSAYWTAGPLLFVLGALASAKDRFLYASLRCKWLELDHVLWRVLGMSSNEREPFSLHVRGAFVLTGQEILTARAESLKWQDGVLMAEVGTLFEGAGEKAREIASAVGDLDSYIHFIQHEHQLLMQRFPRAAVNLHKEELLAALIANDRRRAETIARARISAHDRGGFIVDGKSFYEHALAYCQR